MTRSSDSIPAKQVIPAASIGSNSKKAWKKRLRQACLDRMRQSRPSHHGRVMIAEVPYDSRTLVEAELQLHGVRVVSPPVKNIPPHDNTLQQPQAMECVELTNTEMDFDDDEVGFVMTEDEVIALMEEIEREWKQHEDKLLEEELYRIEGEEQAVWDTIAEYEQWADEANCHSNNNTATTAVLCPICQDANLTTTARTFESARGDEIVCPNFMDGSCRMRLEARPGLSLPTLCERLALAISAHGENCSHQVVFEVSEETVEHHHDSSLSHLWAKCFACERKSRLI
eukprot:scaffold2536_cov169-Amphora_coffeaeformis.AAC.10